MSSRRQQWLIGEQQILFNSPIHNLTVYLTKRKNKQIKKYKSFVDLFTLNIRKMDASKNMIGLSFDKPNFLQTIFESFYTKVMGYYETKPGLKFQIDLHLGTICNIFHC